MSIVNRCLYKQPLLPDPLAPRKLALQPFLKKALHFLLASRSGKFWCRCKWATYALTQMHGLLPKLWTEQVICTQLPPDGQSGLSDVMCRSMQCAASGASSSGRSASGAILSQQDLSLLSRLLRWPAPHLFPSLDIARLAILDEHAAASLASTAGPLLLSPQGMMPSVRCISTRVQ